MDPTIYVDLRCLQDPRYRVRGIGQHVAAILRARRQNAHFAKWKTVGLIDLNAPKLEQDDAVLFDALSASLNPCCGTAPNLFIDGTPMTHDARFDLRFQSHPVFFSAAVVYDFIPLEWPGYLPTVSSRVDYLAKMARLRNFDFFLPISEYTASGLFERLAVPRHRLSVTGASVRGNMYELANRLNGAAFSQVGRKPYFVAVIAYDPRKNPEVAVKAVRHLNLLYGGGIKLKIVGHYEEFNKRAILSLAGHEEGGGFVEFCEAISDEELVALYAGAVATIAPSHVEGFSLPVVEAAVCGCPVVASTCAAHMELIDQPEALFPSDDVSALVERLEAVLRDPALRASLVNSQAHLSQQFHEKEVGKRFWNAIEAGIESRRTPSFISKVKKPRFAFLSPYPPDRSGVANYTAMAMRAGEDLFDSDLYSDAQRPLSFEGKFRDAGPVSLAPLVKGDYEAVISVLGNSHFHSPIFEIFERHGGPCILHDARLTQIYFHRLGQTAFLNLARRLLARPVEMEEVHTWLADRSMPSLFLEPIVERAAPLIVHTVTQQAQIKRRYGVDAQLATCCPTKFFNDQELTTRAKQAARERLGIASDDFLVSTFGIADSAKGAESCVLAVELLRSWNIPVQFYFVGRAVTVKPELQRLSKACDITPYVHYCADDGFVDEDIYRAFLIASDAAVQLRTYGFGQLSAALTDCISAGMPCVASTDLAQSCDAPEFVSRVPDIFSPLFIAEQLASIWENRGDRRSTEDTRITYLQTHNFEYYAKRLTEILGFA